MSPAAARNRTVSLDELLEDIEGVVRLFVEVQRWAGLYKGSIGRTIAPSTLLLPHANLEPGAFAW
jgi:hypothetical protein